MNSYTPYFTQLTMAASRAEARAQSRSLAAFRSTGATYIAKVNAENDLNAARADFRAAKAKAKAAVEAAKATAKADLKAAKAKAKDDLKAAKDHLDAAKAKLNDLKRRI